MEAALELEDDLFFKDLSKQISLLIMDDDDEHPLSHSSSLNLQAFGHAIIPARQASFVKSDHLQSSRRSESKGTGVFIPLCSNPRRKNHVSKQARFMPSGNRIQRPDYQISRGLPSMGYGDNMMVNQSHDHSFNPTRF